VQEGRRTDETESKRFFLRLILTEYTRFSNVNEYFSSEFQLVRLGQEEAVLFIDRMTDQRSEQ